MLNLADAVEIANAYAKAAGAAWHPDRQVIERASYWYLPVGYVGSCGVVVTKYSGRLTVLGSAFSVDEWLWGYERGLVEDHTTLRILTINDADATFRVLEHSVAAVGRWAYERRAWLKAELQHLPAEFLDQSLALQIPNFRQAERENWFEFAITSPSAAAG